LKPAQGLQILCRFDVIHFSGPKRIFYSFFFDQMRRFRINFAHETDGKHRISNISRFIWPDSNIVAKTLDLFETITDDI
jgi:hypothetical protein